VRLQTRFKPNRKQGALHNSFGELGLIVIARVRWRIRAKVRAVHISASGLIVASMLVAAGLWALEATVLAGMRRTDFEVARQSARNIVSTLSADIERNFELFDLSIRAVIDNLKHPSFETADRDARQLMLFDRAATAKHLGRIHVLNRDGMVLYDSRELNPAWRDVSNRDYFDIHRRLPNLGLFVGAPFTTSSGQQVVGISRRIDNTDGSFGGVVAGTMQLSYFRELFGKVELGKASALGLMRSDGILFMRWPYSTADIGRDLSSTPVYRATDDGDRGYFQKSGAIDGVERLYVYQHLANLPLRLTIGVATQDIYRSWFREAWPIGSVALLLGLAMIGLALFASAELRRRAAAEQRLTALAATDGLTGLCNRRNFDAVLEREWKRARREQKPLALLMIDADHFKKYNDRYGHQMGDEALLAIAEAISGNIRTDQDVAARFGGEEFAVLLPNASLAEAFDVAERIRNAVAELGSLIMQADFPTVSVGLSSRLPKEDEKQAILVGAADSALYAGKRSGRNMCQPEQNLPLPHFKVVA
jgi:diguanylate cyclase (GGDEF)-like protein